MTIVQVNFIKNMVIGMGMTLPKLGGLEVGRK